MKLMPFAVGCVASPSVPSRLAVLLLGMSCIGSAWSDESLPALGGPGGNQFSARCPAGHVLGGIEVRESAFLWAIRPLCVNAIATNQAVPGPASNWHGGANGDAKSYRCPADLPVAFALSVRTSNMLIHELVFSCGQVARMRPHQVSVGFQRLPLGFSSESDQNICTLGLVAVGIHGRSDTFVNKVGLICGEPQVNTPIRPARRVPRGATSGPPRPICDVAREARARNSPAAPGLEAQCRAQPPSLAELDALAAKGPAIASADTLASQLRDLQPEGPARRGFDIGMAAAEGHTAPGPGKQKIHDALSAAEQPGYTTAVQFSLGRNRQKLTDLAAKGEAIAKQDPLTALARSMHSGPALRGFDIGMAAAEGHTEPGPGKQKMHDALWPDEKPGFATAVALSLERNRHLEYAARGTAIAEGDEIIADARTGAEEWDIFYLLGFDIATGIFGDSALESRGAKLKEVRASLGDAARKGFDDSVEFHIYRD